MLKQRNDLHNQYNSLQQENKSLTEEVCLSLLSVLLLRSSRILQIQSKDEINRDLKLALTSSNNDAQTIYNQLRQLNTNLAELQEKYDRDISQRDQQLELFHNEQKQMIVRRSSRKKKNSSERESFSD